MGLLSGKKALILGVANERSIAWGVTQALKEHGAQIALTYQGEILKKRVEPLAEMCRADFVTEVDVTNDDHLKNLASVIKEKWGNFDILVHSIAYAEKEDLHNDFSKTTRQGFKTAHDISAYSLVGLCQHIGPLIKDNGSIMAMTYYGSQKVLPGYNVMAVAKSALETSVRYLAHEFGPRQIRVNSISPGPIKTLAASGVPGLRDLFKTIEENAPMRRNVTIEDVGGTAVYLASDLARAVTGQVIYVDSGASLLAYMGQ